jgi:hypothetical protein
MNASRAGGSMASPNTRKIRLPCGHWVEVPWPSAVPAQMACLVHHQVDCAEPLTPLPASWRALPPAPFVLEEWP